MRATNVRLRLLKVKTLHGEWLPLARQDSTVTRRVSLKLSCFFTTGMSAKGIHNNVLQHSVMSYNIV